VLPRGGWPRAGGIGRWASSGCPDPPQRRDPCSGRANVRRVGHTHALVEDLDHTVDAATSRLVPGYGNQGEGSAADTDPQAEILTACDSCWVKSVIGK
jgi:hypothetical protein